MNLLKTSEKRSLLKYFNYILVAAILLSSQFSFAITKGICSRHISELLGGNHNTYGEGNGININHSLYESAEKILLLSDKKFDVSIGEELASVYPKKKIISSDYEYKGIKTDGHLTKVHMDNTKKFSFEDDSFDVIVLRRGMCLCYHNGKTCGGVNKMGDEMEMFFNEVVRVLNKKKPGSKAILHGSHGETHITNYWIHLLEKIENLYNIKVNIHTKEVNGKFSSIEIITL